MLTVYKVLLLTIAVLTLSLNQAWAGQSESSNILAAHAMNWSKAKTMYSGCHAAQSGNHVQHPVLGDCPSEATLSLYYASTALLHYTAVKMLPHKYGKALETSNVQYYVSLNKSQSKVGFALNF